MNLLLTRFSQDVNLSNPDKVNYFLVFETEEGAEVRLPVQKETTETLVKMVYGSAIAEKKLIKSTEKVAAKPPPPQESDESEDGDSYVEKFDEFGNPDPDLEDEEHQAQEQDTEEPSKFESEDDIPSL